MKMRRRRRLGASAELEPVLRAHEREIVRGRTETALVFDQGGTIVLRKRGSTRRVKFNDDEMRLMRDGVLTHNHPTSGCTVRSGDDYPTYEVGSSLSAKDVAMAAKTNAAEVRAVTRTVIGGEQRTVVYSARRPPGGWPESWKITDAVESAAAHAKAMNEIAYAQKKVPFCEVMASAQHDAWLKVAPKLGIEYSSTVLAGAQPGGRRRRRRLG